MKQKSKNRWKRTFSMCLAFQMAVTTPAAGVTLPVGDQGSKINTGRYAAVFDPVSGGGSLALFQGSSPDNYTGDRAERRVKYRCGNGNPAGQ